MTITIGIIPALAILFGFSAFVGALCAQLAKFKAIK